MVWSKAALVFLVLLALQAACTSRTDRTPPTAAPAPIPAITSSVRQAPAPAPAPTGSTTSVPGGTPLATGATSSITQTLARLGGRPCPASKFTCVTLPVPRDHFASKSVTLRPLDIVFAVLPASGKRKGTFITAVGGPGTSGVALADSYADALDASVRQHFDIVFFDQRGVGLSGGLDCAVATTAYDRVDQRADTPEQRAALIAAAQTFAQTCAHEIGSIDKLQFLDTRQAAEDLESFRQAIGDDKLWIYGESYGTLLAQAYARLHAVHLAGMILDGAVDPTLSGPEFVQQTAIAFGDILTQTLAACAATASCAADAGGDPLRAYDTLAVRLGQTPLKFRFPKPSGAMAERSFTRADLDTATTGYLSTPDARMLLLRALSAAFRGDLVPLARLLYGSEGLDEENPDSRLPRAYSEAAYFAVTCSDYEYFSGTPQQRAQAYLHAGDAIASPELRLSSVFYDDLPCVFWPTTTDVRERPQALTAQGVPVLVLAATADPLTPIANAARIVEHLADGYLVTTLGGSHVTFGRGDTCPDKTVTSFLVAGILPAQRRTECNSTLISEYVPIAPESARSFANPLESLISFYNAVTNLPEYIYWDGARPLAVGCSKGGNLVAEHRLDTDQFTFNACTFSDGFAASGSGAHDVSSDQGRLVVTVNGVIRDHLTFERNSDGTASAVGTYAGKAVNLTNKGK